MVLDRAVLCCARRDTKGHQAIPSHTKTNQGRARARDKSTSIGGGGGLAFRSAREGRGTFTIPCPDEN